MASRKGPQPIPEGSGWVRARVKKCQCAGWARKIVGTIRQIEWKPDVGCSDCGTHLDGWVKLEDEHKAATAS